VQVRKVGVVGCGLMGAGIAQVCAQAGYQVVVSEINNELLQKGLEAIRTRLAKDVAKSKLAGSDRDAALARIKGTTDTRDFAACDLVIEAATENLETKKKIFAGLDGTCAEDTILATNTSGQSVIDIATVTGRTDKVLGLHFFNPVQAMKLVEIIRTVATSDATVKICHDFVTSLDKTPATTRDTPGFIVNRLLAPFLLDAVRLLESGLATREDIDNAVTLGLNHPMGPLRLLDLIGLDTLYAGASAMYDELKDPRFAPPTLMKKMVTAGWLGRKTGKGFYEYEP
jgi:3-hydroxybutyryl-CoA dehydrogenase